MGTKTVNLGNAAVLGITASDFLTATTTDADNNTSEFFPPFAPLAAEVSISGRVLNAQGNAISKAQITITEPSGATRTVMTNAFGYYRFDEVAAGETYILSIAHKSYQFANSPRILFVGEDLEDIDFTASP